MSNPLNRYKQVRVNRSKILYNLHQFFSKCFDTNYERSSASNLMKKEETIELQNGVVIRQKSGKQKGRVQEWYEIDINQTNPNTAITSLDTDTSEIVAETIQPNLIYTVDTCEPIYGVTESGIWSTKQFIRGFDYIVKTLELLGMEDEKIQDILDMGTEIAEIIQEFNPTKSEITELILMGDVDAIESLTSVTYPDSVQTLRRNSLQSYGDEFPPIPRSFVMNSENVQIEYEDADITLLRGQTGGYDLGLLVGIDDESAFYHPMPRSLRIDNPNYQVNRDTIRSLMAYDEEWNKGQVIEEDTWYRVQGDLLMKQLSERDIIEKYQQVELCTMLDDEIQKKFLSQTPLHPLDGQIRFTVVRPNILPRITVSYPSGPAQRTITDDIREIMKFDDDIDVGVKLVDMLIDWILENHDVARSAKNSREQSLSGSAIEQFVTQLDNHLLFVDDARLEPEPEDVYRDFMPDNRDFTYFRTDSMTSLTLEHNEHDQIPITLDSGTYLLTLARRRNR